MSDPISEAVRMRKAVADSAIKDALADGHTGFVYVWQTIRGAKIDTWNSYVFPRNVDGLVGDIDRYDLSVGWPGSGL